MSARPMLEIPVTAAKEVADRYGYDQVVIIARRVGDEPEPHGEHVTTYGRDKAHCGVAARVGNFIKHKIMGWPEYEPAAQGDAEDAARWRETLMHVGAANHLGSQHFTLNTLRIVNQMFLLRGSVAQHFTKCIDASRAARSQAKKGPAA